MTQQDTAALKECLIKLHDKYDHVIAVNATVRWVDDVA